MYEPLRLSTPGVDFDELNELRLYLERILERGSPSLRLYCDEPTGGFVHLLNTKKPGDFSRTSTATVVAFLTRSGQWRGSKEPWSNKAQSLANSIMDQPFASSGLLEGNPFTTAFLLEAVEDLREHAHATLNGPRATKFRTAVGQLARELRSGSGVSMKEYPPTSFMTQKALRVVNRCAQPRARDSALLGAGQWAWRRLYEESVAVAAGRPDADIFELGYSALTASMATNTVAMTPKQRTALEFSLTQFFAAQNENGSWPRSQPLFHYPTYGDAYCYDYEFLVQLLQDPQLHHVLHANFSSLAKAAYALDATKIPLSDNGATGWASGHLKQNMSSPESWTTASAYHYCFALKRLVVEAIRRSIFAYTSNRYTPPAVPASLGLIDRSSFLDSPVTESLDSDPSSLTQILEERFLAPIAAQFSDFDRGLPINSARSAILYGPPGTSKTKLAELIASSLGWPLLKLDPSHLTRDGLDRLHAETNRIFTMLDAGEQMVVLLDEFDELVRDRDEKGTESASRFLTTAMLPKLTALYNRKRVVFLVATNHVERFDPAIARDGRFDMILPVMPPSLDAKLEHWPEVARHLRSMRIMGTDAPAARARSVLADLTFAEFGRAVPEISKVSTKSDVLRVINILGQKSTMQQPLGEEKVKWAERMLSQQSRIRVPQL